MSDRPDKSELVKCKTFTMLVDIPHMFKSGVFLYNDQGWLFMDCVHGTFSWCPGDGDFINRLRSLDDRGISDFILSMRSSNSEAAAQYGAKPLIHALVHKFLFLLKNDVPVVRDPDLVYEPVLGQKYYIGTDVATNDEDFTVTLPSGKVVTTRVPAVEELEAMSDDLVNDFAKRNFTDHEKLSMDEKRQLIKYHRDINILAGNNKLQRPLAITFNQGGFQ